MSVCVAFIFHLIITKFTLYPLLDYTLYRIVPVYLLILTVYKHTSVDAHRVTRPIELVLYTHSLRENYSLVKLVQERLSGKAIVRETSVKRLFYTGCWFPYEMSKI